MSETRAGPHIGGQDCVHVLAVEAHCKACVEVCPKRALTLDDDGLQFELESCDNCGLCVPVCPRRAIVLPDAVTDAITILSDRTASATCAWVSSQSGFPCRHALGTRELDALAAQKVRTLTLHVGDCNRCIRNRTEGGFDNALSRHVAVRQSRGETPLAVIQKASVREGSSDHGRTSVQTIDQSRRRFFGAVLGRDTGRTVARAAQAFAYLRPAIDPGRCIACDACARICPDGAIARVGAPGAGYRIEPDLCHGCGLCVDLCEHQAISLAELAPAEATFVPLAEQRCRACGAPFARIAGTPDDDSRCPICRTRGHTRNLFQVVSGP